MYDKIIIGAGLYGLYSALYCGKKQEKILVVEYDKEPFGRATYINQARVHMGYHYPRSYSTAIKSAGYFEKFVNDYPFSILADFDQVYATSKDYSWTNAEQFIKFCNASIIKCDRVDQKKYFKNNMCDGAFLTKEYTFDAQILKEYFINEIKKYKNVEIKYNAKIDKIEKVNNYYEIITDVKERYKSNFILNCTYASVNQIL